MAARLGRFLEEMTAAGELPSALCTDGVEHRHRGHDGLSTAGRSSTATTVGPNAAHDTPASNPCPLADPPAGLAEKEPDHLDRSIVVDVAVDGEVTDEYAAADLHPYGRLISRQRRALEVRRQLVADAWQLIQQEVRRRWAALGRPLFGKQRVQTLKEAGGEADDAVSHCAAAR